MGGHNGHQGETTDFDRMIDDLQREIADREREIYSQTVIEEAYNPKNIGRMSDPDVHGIVHGWCGDTMEIYLKLNGERVERVTFVTDGCGATIACGSRLTQLVTGRTLEEAGELMPGDLIEALDGLPEESVHCAELAVSTLQNALFNLRLADLAQEGGVE
ncbi:MAG: iron-sulfur cluster assembly scaffold protein [Anaerolineae bacterium]